MPMTIRPASTITFISLSETNTIGYYGPTLNGGTVDFGLLADISGKVCQGLYSP